VGDEGVVSGDPSLDARTGLELVPMRPDHVEAVAAIEAEASASPWTPGLFRGEFDLPAGSRTWIVAVRDGSVVGFAGAMYVEDEAHVMNVAVDPAERRQGIGRALFATLADEATRRARHLTLEVRTSNVAARQLYRRFGLAPAGVRRRYYPDGEDALVMWAHDIDQPAYRSRLDDAAGRRS
jgi:[ribosomal protein S18]-alanine N-acetyltransferase